MSKQFSDDLALYWSLDDEEVSWLGNKCGPTRLGFAAQLKFYRLEKRFPVRHQDVPEAAIALLAQQTRTSTAQWGRYELDGRSAKYHRAQIRSRMRMRPPTKQDGQRLQAHLSTEVQLLARSLEAIKQDARRWCHEEGLESPTPSRLERLVRSAMVAQETRHCSAVLASLPTQIRERLEALLLPWASPQGGAVIQVLAHGPGAVSADAIQSEIIKLERIRSVGLPAHALASLPAKAARLYARRAIIERPYELRRHPQALRLTMLAAFCQQRQAELTDTLVDIVIRLVHRMSKKAERRLQREILADVRRVTDKHGILYRLAQVSLDSPEGMIKDVIFPVANEKTLENLVKEAEFTGNAYRQQAQALVRKLYGAHYRRLLAALVGALTFGSENPTMLQALDLLRRFAGSKVRYFPKNEDAPLDLLPEAWQTAAVHRDDTGSERVHRASFEIGALTVLRDQLRCKETWVQGAQRHRDPNQDLPQDFEQRRSDYYATLKLTTDTGAFVEAVREKLDAELSALDKSLATDPHVRISNRGGGWIHVSPLDSQSEPENLAQLKTEMTRRWPMTGLLDILKEADLRLGFTDVFHSASDHRNMDPLVLQQRLLLCLYGLGTNAGLKRVAAGSHATTYQDLQYIRRRFINVPQLRHAIAKVVDATLRARWSHIWGEATTACASDSKQFPAWDQNLLTEWHARYGGRGVMIYWHVERKSTCIYSQLKSCSSSEVAAMIEGVLRHCTTMAVEKNYVDTHGQSEVAFAFCRLLGFQLLPRIKRIHKQSLYRAHSGQPERFANLQPVLTRPINWQLIAQQYDAMVKYATAMREGNADAETILRRFTRNNLQHPTYKGLAELGRAEKSIFLCRYLRLIELRREIQEGLNVVESWNRVNNFILFGNASEFATNRHEDQEVTMLALHLLQVSLVYINTLMMQDILDDPDWLQRLTARDLRALTPLAYSHVTPYGNFKIDLNDRLEIAGNAARTKMEALSAT